MNLYTKAADFMRRFGMLILCFFLGMFGVHKFVEKKPAMGILYLFTLGLCGFGWLFDCVRYLVQGLSTSSDLDPTNESSSFDTAVPSASVGHAVKTVFLWILAASLCVSGLGGLASGSILAGLALIALGVLLLPINTWQALLGTFLKKGLKGAVAAVLVVLFVIGASTDSTPPSAVNPVASPVTTTAVQTNTPSVTTTVKPTTSTATNPTTVTTVTQTTTKKTADVVVITTTTSTVTTTTVTTTIHIHTFADATCILPQTCAECGAEQGEPLGHSWQGATCTSPETCSACGETGGSAIGHSYADGSCINCGSEDPEYTSHSYVLNTKTKKFHYPSCRDVDKIKDENRQDYTGTRDELLSWDYDPCGHCNP